VSKDRQYFLKIKTHKKTPSSPISTNNLFSKQKNHEIEVFVAFFASKVKLKRRNL